MGGRLSYGKYEEHFATVVSTYFGASYVLCLMNLHFHLVALYYTLALCF